MRTKTKLVSELRWYCLSGISNRGQRYLIGQPSADHRQRDDQYVGAGLAPYVYCLAPCLIPMILGTTPKRSWTGRVQHRAVWCEVDSVCAWHRYGCDLGFRRGTNP